MVLTMQRPTNSGATELLVQLHQRIPIHSGRNVLTLFSDHAHNNIIAIPGVFIW